MIPEEQNSQSMNQGTDSVNAALILIDNVSSLLSQLSLSMKVCSRSERFMALIPEEQNSNDGPNAIARPGAEL